MECRKSFQCPVYVKRLPSTNVWNGLGSNQFMQNLTKYIAKIKLGFSSPKVIDLTAEKSRENSLVFY
jgi:hypothetical protein